MLEATQYWNLVDVPCLEVIKVLKKYATAGQRSAEKNFPMMTKRQFQNNIITHTDIFLI